MLLSDEERRAKHRETMRVWRAAHREQWLAGERNRARERYATDPEYRAKRLAREKARAKKRYAENIDASRAKAREKAKAWKAKNPAKVAAWQKRWKFGTLRKKFGPIDHLLTDACAICKSTFTEKGARKRCLDHCHETGVARAFLCHRCNVGLGCFADNHELLEAAAAYLRGHKQAVA